MQRPRLDELVKSLVGAGAVAAELPPLTDLLAVLLALAEGTRRKALLPLASSTGEFAFVRRGEQVLVSYYDGGPVPQVFVRDRPLGLCELLASTTAATLEQSALWPSASQEHAQSITDRARRTVVKVDPLPTPSVVVRRAGALHAPEGAALAFGFSVKLSPGEAIAVESGTRADVHALLFDGELWAFARGRRVTLVRGPVFPAVARMVSAARSAVEAWEAQRAASLKLKAGEFGISLRIGKNGEARLSLASKSGAAGESVTLPQLDLASTLLPILRLASDLVRTVVSTDRAQSKNLRLAALRDEVRALRRILRTRSAQKSFVNRDPELLRASSVNLTAREPTGTHSLSEASGRLRLSLRWRAEVDGLDAASTFLCGDRIIVATPRSQLALSREDGELLWMREASATATFMAGTSLLCASPDGELTLCDLDDGQVYARTHLAPRVGGAMLGMFAGARGAPPIAVLTEGRDRLVAVDTRTGTPRWRFRSHGRGEFKLTRAGRILLVVSGDSTLDAIDVATGEVAWRWSDPGRLSLTAAVTRDHAIAISSQGPGASALLCFDLFSGQLVFRKELVDTPTVGPIATEQLAIVAGQHGPNLSLSAFDLHTGQERWRSVDPGIGEGAAPLVVDQHLVVNAPSGTVYAIDLASGELRWQHRLADPTRDDVPRRLEPVLRGGALFMPSASVHVIRPADGSLMGGPIAERIIPDFMRVDERGWLYVAEESGLIEAHAPIPTLRLIK
ncbi:MAG: putative cell surface protein [Myxococcaceae bacterium]|nr:putative cell surface protein [Myxococcaceae bacterium]